MPHVSDYRVKLDAFEGPMDLLLFLIRRAEVEITDIPLSTITEQYLAYLREGGVQSIDIDKAGEFLVMAATLMEIKSRMLMPRTPGEEGGGGGEGSNAAAMESETIDPRTDLIRQLLAYKKYRDAAQQLHERLDEWESRFPASRAAYDAKRVHEVINEMAEVDLEDLELIDLVSAFSRIVESVDMSRVGEHHVVVDDTPIELHAEDLLDRLSREATKTIEVGVDSHGAAPGEVEFTTIFANRSRGEMIGLFLAMLELVRQRKVGVRQDSVQQTIFLRLRDEPDDISRAADAAEAAAKDD